MDLFGRSLSVVIDVLDPDVVVLGGGVSNLDELYEDGVAAVRRWVFNDTLETRIVRHALGDSARRARRGAPAVAKHARTIA